MQSAPARIACTSVITLRPGRAHRAVGRVDRLVDEALQAEPPGEGRWQDQAGAGHRPIVVEPDLQPIRSLRCALLGARRSRTIWVTS
jgi:hypothetical protein